MRNVFPILVGLLLCACEQRGLSWHGSGALADGSPGERAGPRASAEAAAGASARPVDRNHTGADVRAPNPGASAVRAPAWSARAELSLGAKGAGVVRVPGSGALLAVALEQPGALLWVRGDGAGAARIAARTEADGWPLPPVALRGADGAPRIALASRETARVQVFDPRRTEAPEAAFELPDTPVAIAAGDLGADGRDELLIVTRDGRLIAVDDSGQVRSVELDGERASCLHVSADGRHVALGWQLPRSLARIPAERIAGDASIGIEQVELPGIPRAMLELDLDGDGTQELLVAGGAHELWVFDAAAPELALQRALQLPGELPIALAAEDLDGDGRDELLSLNALDSNYGVQGDFDGERFALFTSEYAGQSPLDLAVCDLDEDGRPDLCVVGRDSAALGVARGTGRPASAADPFAEAARIAVGTNPLAVAARDLDGDGRAEVVALCGGDGSGSLFALAQLPGGLGVVHDQLVGAAPRRALLDATGDGGALLDVLLAPTDGSRIVRLNAAADGRFEAHGAPVAVRGACDIARAGAPADGGLWLVDPGSRALGRLDRDASEPRWAALDRAAPVTVARLDSERLLAAGGEHGRAWVALYRWPADATEPTLESELQLDGWPIDLDAAGATAFLLLGNDAGLDQSRIRALDLTSGAPAPGPELPVGARPARVTAGDLNRDGRVDAAIAAQNAHRLELVLAALAADGSARLVAGPRLSGGLGPLDVALADVDGDGWLDLVSANAFSHDVSVVRALPAEAAEAAEAPKGDPGQ